MVFITIPNYRAKSRNQTITAHWRTYQKFRDEIANFMWGYAGSRRALPKNIAVYIRAYYAQNRAIDASNIDDKMFIDALMKIGLLTDDDPEHNPLVIKETKINTKQNKVEVIVGSVPDIVKYLQTKV